MGKNNRHGEILGISQVESDYSKFQEQLRQMKPQLEAFVAEADRTLEGIKDKMQILQNAHQDMLAIHTWPRGKALWDRYSHGSSQANLYKVALVRAKEALKNMSGDITRANIESIVNQASLALERQNDSSETVRLAGDAVDAVKEARDRLASNQPRQTKKSA